MKKVLIGIGVVVGVCGIALTVMAAKHESVIRPNISVGEVSVAGLTLEEAQKKVREWWETERRKELTLTNPSLKHQVPPRSASRWGIVLDDQASLAQVKVEDFWDSLGRQVGINDAPPKQFELVFKADPSRLDDVKRLVADEGKTPNPAKVSYVDGVIQKTPESNGFALDDTKVFDAAMLAMKNGGSGELPLTEAPKHVSDEALAAIKDVVSSYSTNFPNGKVDRCANIRLASKNLSGMILLPGEKLSFNDVLGKRTIAAGYRVAPVIKNGKHDFDVGGGLCQVSTTLYNAVLLANLKIIRRENHSLPSAYVPLGRDATVDYGSHDMQFMNDSDKPVAIVSKYEPGKLTYYVLGTRDPSLQVKIETEGARRWSRGTKIVQDGSLPAGKQKVIDKGGSAASVSTYRIVFKDGVQVKKELINRSMYSGSPKIIAVGSKAPAAPKAPATGAPDSAPGTVPPTGG